MKIAIIQFPGSNCEAESSRAIRAAGMEPIEFLWNDNYTKLENFEGYFIVGGFSYEDRGRAGIIASLDPVMKIIAAESEKGKPVLGICNGAQILVETGLVPGLENNQIGMALAVNKRVSGEKILGTGFYNAWVNITLSSPNGANAFTSEMAPGQIIKLPVAHAEGRFIIPDDLLKELIANDQTVFRYCDGEGRLTAEFPINPNGAAYNLAAVSNAAGNILAMMPHPERCASGQPIFASLRNYISQKRKISVKTLSYAPPACQLPKYEKPANARELITELIITDNEAETIRKTLQDLGIHANISRKTHWEISGSKISEQPVWNSLIESGELFNSNKEKIAAALSGQEGQPNHCAFLLVRYRDDFVGKSKLATLTDKFGVSGVTDIKKSTLWRVSVERGNIEEIIRHILATRILFNQFSQECLIL